MPVAFVTGVTGQDGGYLAERLTAGGWTVHGLVAAGDPVLAEQLMRTPDLVVHEGDLADAAGLERLVADVAPDRIFNLGGISSVALSWAKPHLTGVVTGLAPVSLLTAAAQLQRAGRDVRLVQASSAEIFGDPRTSPQHEGTPIAPTNPYGAAKAYAHHMTGLYRARGLHASTAILFNHESPRRPDTFVTRKITKAAVDIARGRQQRLKLGNLDARRDWGWAPDYIDALCRMVEHDEPGDYVVATGTAHSVRDFVAAAFTHVGVDDWANRIELDPELVRPVDAVELVGDATRAREVLGWSPSIDFDQLVVRMVEAETAPSME